MGQEVGKILWTLLQYYRSSKLCCSNRWNNITPCGDYKIHTFTADGCFSVTNAGTPAGSTTVDYLVVAGGGGSGKYYGGGGGGGGYRESSGVASGCYSVSPLGACVSALPVSVTTYPITVGGGGATAPGPSPGQGSSGSNSVFSTITSTGGGYGNGGLIQLNLQAVLAVQVVEDSSLFS
jgi:hypothetical protein